MSWRVIVTIGASRTINRLPQFTLRRPPAVGKHLGHPRGVLGHLAGRMMVRGNESLNEWLVDQLAERNEWDGSRIVEVGFGPGLGLANLLAAFPSARVWGIDHSAVMVQQARFRNIAAVRSGRLTLRRGDVNWVGDIAPIDLVVVVNVLYFWSDPHLELQKIRRAIGPGGAVCVGYHLRRHMSEETREALGANGHRFFDTDGEVETLLRNAGFRDVQVMRRGPLRMQLAYA